MTNKPSLSKGLLGWFYWHQPLLLEMSKHARGRELLGISKTLPEKAVKFRPDSITTMVKPGLFVTDFRTAPTFARHIVHNWKEFSEYEDYLANQQRRQDYSSWREMLKGYQLPWYWRDLIPVAGGTESTFHPDASPETNTIDGFTQRQGVDETFATIRAGNGTGNSDSSTVIQISLKASTTTDQYADMIRGVFGFDTSPIDDADSIDAAVFGFIASHAEEDEFTEALQLSFVESAAGASTNIVNTDYQGDTAFNTKWASDFTASDIVDTSTYHDITFNATGRVAVDKTGITEMGARTTFDVDNTAPTWGSGQEGRVRMRSADTAGTTSDPRLVVTHTAVGASLIYNPKLRNHSLIQR